MLVIGLTGSSGSGKSTVSQMLQEQEFDVINCDSVARDVVRPGSPCLNAIFEAFGETVRGMDGTLNRRLLADIVFHDKKKLEKEGYDSTVIYIVTDTDRAVKTGTGRHEALTDTIMSLK
mgnify:CR=1 FL=1